MILLAILIDLILLGIIAYGVYIGIKKGFVKIIGKPVKTIASLVLAYTCCSWFGQLVIAPLINAPISGYVSDFMYKNLPNISPEMGVEELPTLIKMAIAAFNVDLNVAPGESYIDGIVGLVASPVVNLISVVLGFIALFFIGKLLFAFAFYLLNKFCSSGLLGKVNKALGMVFGIFMYVFASWSLAVLLSIVFHLPAFDGVELISGFEGGWIYRFFNALNPIVLLLSF